MRPFVCALRGITEALRRERHMRIHLCAAFYVVLAGIITRLDVLSWAAVLLCIAVVFSLELVNTAVESVCDRLCSEYDRHIGLAKDCAAGAVLFSAAVSAIIGCAVFFSGGRPLAVLSFARENKLAAGAIVLTLPIWIYYIFKTGRSHK